MDGPYYSCDQLEGTIIIFPNEIVPCCYPIPEGMIRPALYKNYEEDFVFDIENYRRRKAELVRLNQSDEKPCGNCSYLRHKNWPANDMVNNIIFASSLRCNMNCIYCPQPKTGPRNRQYPLYVMEQLHRKNLLEKTFTYSLSGGEPTLHENFDEGVRFSLEYGYKLTVFTNSLIYSDTLRQALDRGLAKVVTSVDSGTRETYARVKKVDSFEKVWGNLGRYAAGGGLVEVKYIVIEENANEGDIRAFVDCCAAAKVRHVTVSLDSFKHLDRNDGYYRIAAQIVLSCGERGIDAQVASVCSAADRKAVQEFVDAAPRSDA